VRHRIEVDFCVFKGEDFGMKNYFSNLILLAVFFSIFSGSPALGSTPYQRLIKKIDQLISEQKFQAALDVLKSEGQQVKEPLDQARILTKLVQLETGLHDYETAIKNFRSKPWPKDPRALVLLNVFNAYSLQYYAQAYSWEIRQRTKIQTTAAKDLKSWTIEEIYFEAIQGLNSAWADRKELGALPKTQLNDYIAANTYPPGIRDTFRDTLTHLFVEILNDSAGWTPEQSNEIYRLKLPDLMSGKVSEGLSLTSSKIHPLQKISFILHDLKSWHLSQKNAGAALDAQIELLKILHSRFPESEDKAAIMKHLDTLLAPNQSTPWYSMGAGVLAQFWEQFDDPSALVKAKEIAEMGAKKFPTSEGAKLCRDIINRIKSPSLEMNAMRVDGPGRRSIDVRYKNLTRLHFFSFRYDIKNFMIASKDYNHYPDYRELEVLRTKTPTKTWSVDVPSTTDFRQHKASITPPDHKPGFYIVAVSMSPTLQKNSSIVRGSMMVFGDLVLANQSKNGAVDFEVYNGATGTPVKGADIEVLRFQYTKPSEIAKKLTTDVLGKSTFKPMQAPSSSSQFVAFATKGSQMTFQEFSSYSLSADDKPAPARSVIYTDRSIYRPQQKIMWKAVFYAPLKEPGKFKTLSKTEQKVTLHDLNGQVVSTQKIMTDEFGSAWGQFEIPLGRVLGRWSIHASNDSHYVQVEEYKRPSFELSWKPQTTPLRLNHKVEVIGEAKYYFGSPLTSGKVRYTVERKIVFPWWCFFGYWDFGSLQRTQIIETGETSVHSDGTYKIGFFPSADKRLKAGESDVKYTYAINAEVIDDGGETRTSENSIILGLQTIEAHLDLKEQFVLSGKKAEIKLRRTFLSGDPAPGTGNWKLVLLSEPKSTVMPAELPAPSYIKKLKPPGLYLPDDEKQSRWSPTYNWALVVRDWPQKDIVKTALVTTDSVGAANILLPSLKGGAYRLIYETKDSYGTSFTAQTEFLVADSSYRPALPGLLLINRTEAKVGEEVSIWAPTGLKNQTLILDAFQDGVVTESRRLNSTKDNLLMTWKITEDQRGGVGFILRLINDYQSLIFSQNIFVPWDNKEINLEYSRFRNKLRPGQSETWSFKLSGPKREKLKAASVQLLAYMYDRSLDQLSPHYSHNFLSIYPTRFASNAPDIALGNGQNTYFESNLYFPTEFSPLQKDHVIFMQNYAIGGPGRRGGGGMNFSESEMMTPGAVPAADGASPQGSSAAPFANKAESKGDEIPSESAASVPQLPKQQNSAVKSVQQPNEIRSNFSETAFFQPNLKNDENGMIEIKFQVPDSVTSWNLWLQGITQDLMGLSASKQLETVKELMVRPYLPRFLREGDNANLRFVVNNTSDKEMAGQLDIGLLEDDQKSDASGRYKVKKSELTAVPFAIPAKKSFTHTISLIVPTGLGNLYVKATAQSKGHSDGELRSLPILPGRFHLAQSKFITLKDREPHNLEFMDLLDKKDHTLLNEKMTVQIDAQLFYSVLSSLPYLMNSPYECIEQTLNQFISTGIMTSLFYKYPSVEKMAREMSVRKTQYEDFSAADPNRRMSLEETPWLNEAKGGANPVDNLVNILDSRIADQSRKLALQKLEKWQTTLGGFPWFPGGPPSPYITLYVVYGLSKAMEFGVEGPKAITEKAWAYLHKHYLDEIVHKCMSHNGCWETITFLNYILSNYPNNNWGTSIFTAAERKAMLDFSFKNWKLHSPYLKGYLALTLQRANRTRDAKLVWDSVMDSAKYSADEGTHWAREDRSWLWYNDTIETHAFALRTLMELGSEDSKRDGLVQWLFLNKKLNHWHSTRATSEVLYSLAHYLTKTNQMGQREAVTVKVGNEKTIEMEFSPDKYLGKANQLVYEGEKVNSNLMPITIQKSTAGLMFASANWQFSTEELPKESRGDFLNVSRSFFLRDKTKREVALRPIEEGTQIAIGDEIEVHISLKSKHPVGYVHLRDPRGAGFEPTDTTSKHKWDLGIYWYEEVRDNVTNFFFEQLPQGEYNFKYRLRAATAGEFKVSPATVQPMYAPEFAAYSAGHRIKIKGGH
jgi:uncharacterized protein YfaS (alpha-2-macroglobulin family)